MTQLYFEVELPTHDDWYICAVECMAESEDDCPEVKDLYLIVRKDGQDRHLELVSGSKSGHQGLMQIISDRAWAEVKTDDFRQMLEEKWAEENEGASDYYVDPVREYGTYDARAL